MKDVKIATKVESNDEGIIKVNARMRLAHCCKPEVYYAVNYTFTA
ncbi:Uncharacterised protein [Serratia entomophila]|nr:Uncharacterised protein [Serratia entomophila]CAI0765125.1 Uncharacterised protein [Serratia entomophila]CAI0791044.1 Uncharacterised protein [Serratia entomophila]CAI0801065.1 Uncharacterised protein [Serratia entomophila]CAI0801946.1 Uncharacterised protein [Serratia entomophila]